MDCPYPTEMRRNGELGEAPHNKDKCWNQENNVYWSKAEWFKHLVKKEGRSSEQAYEMLELMFRHGANCTCSNAPRNIGKMWHWKYSKYWSKAEWFKHFVEKQGRSSKEARKMVDSLFSRIDEEIS